MIPERSGGMPIPSSHPQGALTLVLNAAEGVLQILAGRDGVPLCAQSWNAPTRSTEILAPALTDLCARLGSGAREISRIACVRGPGSFTGVRLTLATAAALRRSTGALQAGLDYMQALARTADAAASACRTSGAHAVSPTLWVLTHARRNCVHCQSFVSSLTEEPPQPTAPVELLSPEEAARHINGAPAPIVIGSGLVRQRQVFADRCPTALLLPDAAATPTPEVLWRMGQEALYSTEDIEPLYIRPCDAVENLSDIAARQGMDPEIAHAALRRLLDRAPAPSDMPEEV